MVAIEPEMGTSMTPVPQSLEPCYDIVSDAGGSIFLVHIHS